EPIVCSSSGCHRCHAWRRRPLPAHPGSRCRYSAGTTSCLESLAASFVLPCFFRLLWSRRPRRRAVLIAPSGGGPYLHILSLITAATLGRIQSFVCLEQHGLHVIAGGVPDCSPNAECYGNDLLVVQR